MTFVIYKSTSHSRGGREGGTPFTGRGGGSFRGGGGLGLKLFLLFAVLPAIELAILIEIGGRIGVLNTIILILATAMAGAYLVRLEGLSVVGRLQRELGEGRFPGDALVDGGILLVAGAVLITPGFVTDILGLMLVIPATRKIFKGIARGYIKKNMVTTVGAGTGPFDGPFGGYRGYNNNDGDTYETTGEVIDTEKKEDNNESRRE